MLGPSGEKGRLLFVYGASGHAKVVIDSIERQAIYKIAFLVDDDLRLKGREICGYRSIGNKNDLLAVAARDGLKTAVVAIGDNATRLTVANWLREEGFAFATIVHPAATIGRNVRIGAGTVIMPGAVVNCDAAIEEHVIINTGATVDHDCSIGAFSHIAPGSHLCGTVSIGRNSFICAGVTVLPNRSIGSDVTVGAGSTVVDDLPSGVTAIGTPAKILRTSHEHADGE